ncbi:unnamed protein product [Rhizophagus irregularis]|nr:unnamed protein product [Rhizophagus irregularis]CAB5103634.1 unnamed protein product [Rhizophagus irregularis]CAB5382147.1 unnamed protein product [Rhizophagus irregularis]
MKTPGRSPNTVIILIIFDLVMDLLFSVRVREVEWLYIPNTVILLISLAINTLFVLYLSRELHSLGSNVNSVVLLFFTLLSCADVETLNILQSYKFFGSKFSDSTARKIFWVACLGIFVEDIPQISIQILYFLTVGYYDTLTSLSLVSSCTTIAVHVIGRVFNIKEAICPKRLGDSEESSRLNIIIAK